MNSKQCKKLRKFAANIAAGKPATGLNVIRQQSKVVGMALNPKSKATEPVTLITETMANSIHTVRGAYRAMKSGVLNKGA